MEAATKIFDYTTFFTGVVHKDLMTLHVGQRFDWHGVRFEVIGFATMYMGNPNLKMVEVVEVRTNIMPDTIFVDGATICRMIAGDQPKAMQSYNVPVGAEPIMFFAF